MLNTLVRVFLTNPVTKRCRRCQFFHSYTSKQKGTYWLQVYDFYPWWSIRCKRYQLELTLRPLLQIFERPKTCTDPPFLYMRPTEPWSFWAVNSTAICKRICTFPLNVAFILCGPCKRHSEKEVSRKNNDWMGYGVRVVRTPIMVLFDQSSFRILPVYQILVNPRNGLFWQLLSTFEGLLPYGNAKWRRWDHQSEGLAYFQKSTTSAGSLGRFAA